jgi:hemoglobin-like flavoprotein
MIMSPISVTETASLDTDLIQSSYSIIKAQSDEFAESFYQILFDKYPDVKPLFVKTDMEKQKAKLMESLDLVLVNVHNAKAFNSILKDLGKRHVRYGAVLTDYPLIGDALLQALEKHLGKDWNPSVENAWSLAYQAIADTMAEGARSVMSNDLQSRQDREESSKDKIENKQKNESNNSFGLVKIIAIACIGLVVVSGYAIWTLRQPQSNITPNTVGESRIN